MCRRKHSQDRWRVFAGVFIHETLARDDAALGANGGDKQREDSGGGGVLPVLL